MCAGNCPSKQCDSRPACLLTRWPCWAMGLGQQLTDAIGRWSWRLQQQREGEPKKSQGARDVILCAMASAWSRSQCYVIQMAMIAFAYPPPAHPIMLLTHVSFQNYELQGSICFEFISYFPTSASKICCHHCYIAMHWTALLGWWKAIQMVKKKKNVFFVSKLGHCIVFSAALLGDSLLEWSFLFDIRWNCGIVPYFQSQSGHRS